MKKIRNMFETKENRTGNEGAAFVILGLTWMLLDGMMPMSITFIAIGIDLLIKGKKNSRLNKDTI